MRALFFAAAVVLAAILIMSAKQNSAGNSGEGLAGTAPGLPPSPALSFLAPLAAAIAKAENASASTNNPGSLTNQPGAVGVFNSAGVSIFATLQDGWNALFGELGLIFNGQSKYYSPSMTLAQFAQTWTGGDNAAGWAETVASELGVTVDTPLSAIPALQGAS